MVGVVSDKSTVAICPNSYCNFTCCEVANEFYQLSLVRINQCSSHRSGTDCGSCDEGTLLFDSVEYISVNKCTTVLVVNDILDSHSYTSVYYNYDILSCWDWLFVCYYVLLQVAGYFIEPQFIPIN